MSKKVDLEDFVATSMHCAQFKYDPADADQAPIASEEEVRRYWMTTMKHSYFQLDKGQRGMMELEFLLTRKWHDSEPAARLLVVSFISSSVRKLFAADNVPSEHIEGTFRVFLRMLGILGASHITAYEVLRLSKFDVESAIQAADRMDQYSTDNMFEYVMRKFVAGFQERVIADMDDVTKSDPEKVAETVQALIAPYILMIRRPDHAVAPKETENLFSRIESDEEYEELKKERSIRTAEEYLTTGVIMQGKMCTAFSEMIAYCQKQIAILRLCVAMKDAESYKTERARLSMMRAMISLMFSIGETTWNPLANPVTCTNRVQMDYAQFGVFMSEEAQKKNDELLQKLKEMPSDELALLQREIAQLDVAGDLGAPNAAEPLVSEGESESTPAFDSV